MNVVELQAMLDKTVNGLMTQLSDQMPESPYRDFYHWSFSAANSNSNDWAQTTGLTQLVVLTMKLYQGFVSSHEVEDLVTLSIPINIYQVYEIVSDNLAIGLGIPSPHDPAFSARQNLMQTFNQAMIARLQGTSLANNRKLDVIKNIADISMFAQSLSTTKHYAAANQYLKHHPLVTIGQLEYATWPLLAANMESCIDAVEAVAGYQVAAIVREGFIRRYESTSTLLSGVPLTLQQRVEVSTHAILVVPIFAYYLGILCEKVRPVANWSQVIENNSLYNALYIAAQLIRLLNDLGTKLVTQSTDQRQTFIQELKIRAHRDPNAGLRSILQGSITDFDMLLTRIDKDLAHGEFNLGFTDLLNIPSSIEAIEQFEQRLIFCSTLYRNNKARLTAVLEEITDVLEDSTTSKIISRIVEFHEVMYAYSFREAEGEYAV